MIWLIEHVVKQLWATLSEEPSFISSKKLERCLIVSTMLSASLYFIYTHIQTLTPVDLMVVVTPWLTYGGYGMVMTQKDKLINQETNGNQNNTSGG